MRAALLVLAALLALPAASAAGEEVDITEVRAPERTMAGKTFHLEVDLQNKGAARTVYLYAVLYEGRDPDAPCGPITDPRYRTTTPLYQAIVQLPANGRVTFPKEGETWGQRYQAEHVEARETVDELCVFAAERQETTGVDWLDYESVALRTRAQNAPPSGAFTWTPETPRATEDVTFTATGEDADGDPLTFAWDFGHYNVSGRAKATGSTATHAFYPDGTYVVTLTISDGFADTVVTRDVRVTLPQGAQPDDGGSGPAPVTQSDGRWLPVPFILAPLAMLAAALLRRR